MLILILGVLLFSLNYNDVLIFPETLRARSYRDRTGTHALTGGSLRNSPGLLEALMQVISGLMAWMLKRNFKNRQYDGEALESY